MVVERILKAKKIFQNMHHISSEKWVPICVVQINMFFLIGQLIWFCARLNSEK